MNHNKGFFLITAVIVLSIVLLMLGQALSMSSYSQSSGALDFEFKERSYALALACMDYAFYYLDNDLDYVGNQTITVSGQPCTIEPIVTMGSNTIVKTNATVGTSTTKLKLVLDFYLAVVSFTEE